MASLQRGVIRHYVTVETDEGAYLETFVSAYGSHAEALQIVVAFRQDESPSAAQCLVATSGQVESANSTQGNWCSHRTAAQISDRECSLAWFRHI
jgi:hypothetical protein